MATTRKSRAKSKAARATRARKTPPAGRKTKSGNAPPREPLDAFIEAAARVLALPVEPQWRAAIKANLEVNLRLATFVADFALPDEAEPAPVFTA
jgi:hypothetical protein